MSTTMNSMINAIPYYAIMSALDKMGISPDLLARQTAAALMPILEDLKALGGDQMPRDVGEYMEMFKGTATATGMADPDTLRTEVKDHSCRIDLTNCMWQDIAGIAEKAGYKRCPMCIIGTMNTAFLRTFGLKEITKSKIEKKGNNCSVELFSD